MDSRAQVSFDYLITVTFAIVFTIAVVVAVTIMSGITNSTVEKVIEIRNNTIASLLGD